MNATESPQPRAAVPPCTPDQGRSPRAMPRPTCDDHTATPLGVEVMRPTKIQPHHHERRAVVYVRQSSARQVLEHRESTALQYNLRQRAMDYGWPADHVWVIDQDQGCSGVSAEGRHGFQQLLSEVALDHVGLVLGPGAPGSRLARSCKDWYQLLEVCAVFDTLLADQDGLYNPRDYNDRLLLGLKGTLSEAELHVLRQRMNQGRLNKARRGALFNHPPIGYVRGPSGELQLDPDEQVQTVVRMIFQKFDELGSAHAVLRYLARHNIRVGVRLHDGPERGVLQWRRPNRVTIGCLLRHPLYAGAYTWGRRPVDPRRRVAGRAHSGRTTITRAEDCAVFIKDHCPAYISWEQYQSHLARLRDNRHLPDTRGAVREGAALLKGLLVCGRCGGRLRVSYSDKAHHRYECTRRMMAYAEPACQSVSGRPLDELVVRELLAALQPAGLELSLSAAADVQRERAELDRHWRQRLERTGYERERAARQYYAVEPENRLVARELEKRWEQALAADRELQEEYERFGREQPSELSTAEREAIRALASDIPALWHAATTTPADRQTLVRCLVERIVVTPRTRGECPAATPALADERVDVTIHFAGGLARAYELRRPVARYEQLSYFRPLMDRIRALAQERRTAPQIAAVLNQESWHPPKCRQTFNPAMVQTLLGRLDGPGPRPRALPDGLPLTSDVKGLVGAHEWLVPDLARALGAPYTTVDNWRRCGWIHGRQLPGPQGRWIVWADDDELNRLRTLRGCPRDGASAAQMTVLKMPKPGAGCVGST